MPAIFNNRTLKRERVTLALVEASAHPLIVITAPMGYGKTTAAREFAAVSARPLYFATVPSALREDGNNLRYLWQQIGTQLARQGFSSAPDIASLGFPEDPFQMDRILDICFAHPDPAILVLDDYHNIKTPPFDLFIEALVRAQVPGLSVLIISRERPNLPLEEMAMKGLAVHLDQNFLAFSEEETREFFRLHQSEDQEAASSAFRLCEGWPAATWLTLQSWLTHGIIAPSRDMELLLSRTVFPAYTLRERRLLLSLSILESFTPRQAADISGEPSAPRLLRKLLGKNALISHTPAADLYQLHSIFRSFLDRRLEEVSGADAPGEEAYELDKTALHRRAGEWFAAHGDPVRAIHFFARAGRDEDFLRVLEIFSQPGDGLIVVLDPEGIPAIMESIPWRIRLACPIGFLGFLFHYLIVDPQKGYSLLEETVRRVEAADFPPKTLSRLKGEIELIYSIFAFNDVRAIVRHHIRAAEFLGGEPSAIHLPQQGWTFGSPHLSYQYLREPGEYEELVEIGADSGNFKNFKKISGGGGAGLPEILRAERRLERGEFEEVEPFLRKAIFKEASKNQLTGQIVAGFALARLHLAGNRRSEALELFREISPTVEAARNTLLDTLTHIAQGYVGAVAGEAALMEIWLRHGPETMASTLRQGQTFATIVYGGALRFFGRWPELEALGETLEEDLGRFRNLFGYIHSYLMRTIAAWHLRGREAALPLFRRALELAGPDGIVLPIAEYGPHVLPLVKEAAQEGACSPKLLPLTRIIASLTKQGKGHAPPTPHTRAFLDAFGCTARERAVLGYIISGLDVPAISEALGISESAVRYHQTGLFKKTGQATRRRLMDFFRTWKPG